MDPLSLSASIAGLFTLAEFVAEKGYKYLKGVHGAKSEISALICEVTALFGVLHSLYLVARRFDGENFDYTLQVHHVRSCQVLLEKIDGILEKAFPRDVDGGLISFRKSLRWPLSSSETKELILELERHKSTLSLALNADNINVLLVALGRQKDIVTSQARLQDGVDLLINESQNRKAREERAKRERERRELLNSWTALDPEYQQLSTIQLRHPNTGTWFTEGGEFKEWADGSSQALWLSGIPGAGKTVLTSTIIKTLSTRVSSNPDEFLAYFYCDYKQPLTHDPVNILKSLIKQLAKCSDEAMNQLEDFCHNRGQKQSLEITSSTQELGSFFRTMTKNLSKVYVVVDALDECLDTRSQVLESLKELYISPMQNIKVLYTSRKEFDIEEALKHFKEIPIAARNSDLKLYVASEIEKRTQSRQLRIKDPELKVHIMEELVNQAQGMFRWAACQLDHLCEMPTDKARKEALKHLPPTLFGTYERILERVNNTHNEHVKTLVERTLRWIVSHVFGSGLSTEALIEAISINRDDTCRDESAMAEEPDILRWCSSLVRKNTESGGIEIAHFTVEEFLVAIDPTTAPHLARYRQHKSSACEELATTALTYLNFTDFSNTVVTDPEEFLRVVAFPFWDYAARNWDFYYRESSQSDLVVQLARNFFDPSTLPQFITWSRYILMNSSNEYIEAEDEGTTGSVPALNQVRRIFQNGGKSSTLHWAAKLALESLCQWLVLSCDVNCESEIGYPLQCAIDGAEVDEQAAKIIVEVFLLAGANVNVHSLKIGNSPLTLAVKNEYLDILDLLLKSGALVDKDCLDEVEKCMTRRRRDHDKMPLRFFESCREVNIPSEMRPLMVMLGTLRDSTTKKTLDLLKNGFNTLLDDFGVLQSEMLYSAQWGKTDIVLRLLQFNKLLISAEDDRRNNALHLASKSGHVETVQALLDMGVAVDIANDDGDSPTLLAISCENKDIFDLLIQRGVDIFRANRKGENAFILAAKTRSIAIMKVLLELDSSRIGRFSTESSGMTVILCALGSQSPEMLPLVASYLLPEECLVKTVSQETGLHLASKKLNVSAMALFLQKGALDESDENGDTALHHVLNADENETARFDGLRLLLQKGANVNISNYEGMMPVHCVLQRWNLPLLKLLIHSKNGTMFLEPGSVAKFSPLHCLVSNFMNEKDKIEMLRYLLSEFKPDLETVNDKGQTPFLLAMDRLSNGYDAGVWEEVILLFSQYKANPNATDIDGSNALHYVSKTKISSGNDLLKKLLELGLNIIHRNKHEISCFDIIMKEILQGEKGLLPRQFGFRDTMTIRLSILISHASNAQLQTLEKEPSSSERLLVFALKNGLDSLISALTDKALEVDESYSNDPAVFNPLEAACVYPCPMSSFEILADKSSDLSRQNKFGNTLLIFASSNNRIDKVRALIQRGVDLETRNFAGYTALFAAVQDGKGEIVKILLDTGASMSHQLSPSGYSVWHSAATQIDGNIMDLLCDSGRLFDVEATTVDGKTPLLLAVSLSRVSQVKKLLDLGANCSAIDNAGLSALHFAAANGQPKILDLVLESSSKPDLEVTTSMGETPLFLAASKGSMYAFETLLKFGASPKVITNDGKTLLHAIAAVGQAMMLEILSAGNVLGNVEARDTSGYTPLIVATQYGQKVIVEMLLDRGADPMVTPNTTPDAVALGILEWIAVGGYHNILMLYLARDVKFNFDSPLDPDRPPLMAAVASGKSPVVGTLLKAGANMNYKGPKSGWNMVHQAAHGNQRSSLVEAIHYATENGQRLDFDAKDSAGKTPSAIAEESGHMHIVDLLDDYSKHLIDDSGEVDAVLRHQIRDDVEHDRKMQDVT